MTAVDAAAPRDSRLSDRLLAAWPVAFSFLVVSSLYVWQASKHPTPWLFSDEVEYAQISRAIAETGKPARRGVEYWGGGLFPWLIAPFWWIGSIASGYSAIKTFNALVMTAAIFPTYALARMLVSRPYALLAAVGTVLAPFFYYSAMVMQEPVAYFAAALSFWVAALVLVRPTRWTIAGAAAVSVVTPLVRDELIVVPAIIVGALAIRTVWVGRGRAMLADASAGRRALYGVLAAVALVVALVVARAGATQVDVAFDRPHTMLDQTLWAWAALTVGLGVLPVVIGLGMTLPSAAIPRTRELVAFTSVLGAAVVLVSAYVAVKGTYQAAVFEARVEERNVVYLAPLLFVGLALFASSRSIRLWALGLSAAFVAWCIQSVRLDLRGLDADAPGLTILSRLADDNEWGPPDVRRLLYTLVIAAVLVGLAPTLLRRRRAASWIVVGAACLSIGWATWAETIAAKQSNDFAQLFETGLPKPPNWIDEATGGKPAVYIGQKIADPNGIWSMEFWNRDVRKVWSLDGTAPGPGPVLTPSLASTDGRLKGDPGYEFAVVDKGLAIAGTTVTQQGDARVVRISEPLRLNESLAGVFQDGWIGSKDEVPTVTADYNRFVAPAKPGTVYVTLSRKGFCGPKAPGRVIISVGTIALGPQEDGQLGTVTQRRGWVVDSCAERVFPIPTPGGPFHVKVSISPPFQPNALDPANFERRWFGAQLGIAFQP